MRLRAKRNDPWSKHLSPTKGHFCSLLISNIFCNPLFLDLPSADFVTRLKTQFLSFSMENSLCFVLYPCLQKANGAFGSDLFDWRFSLRIRTVLFLRTSHIYFLRFPSPRFYIRTHTCSDRLRWFRPWIKKFFGLVFHWSVPFLFKFPEFSKWNVS